MKNYKLVLLILSTFITNIVLAEEEEIAGLDSGEHGMEAYPDFASAGS